MLKELKLSMKNLNHACSMLQVSQDHYHSIYIYICLLWLSATHCINYYDYM